jgi:hypothetical protein
MAKEPRASNVGGEEDAEGCCIDLHDSEATSDADLPAASGGVQGARPAEDDNDELDGCDLDFGAAEATADEDLPPAAGGVA